jgi:thiosulfate/3-mercaptopyruvate sulfurtransferase
MGVLLTVTELRTLLDSGAPVVVLDVRWALGDTGGRERYRAGHVPGAVFVDLESELAAPPSPALGRHPLPALADLEAAARRWGVRTGVPVVVHDDGPAMAAARAWWLLRWAGVPDVRILDGGWAAWAASGGPRATGEETATVPGDVRLAPGGLAVVDADAVARLAAPGPDGAPATGVVLDARAAERFRGEVEPVDPRAGHVPGAVSAPTAANVGPDGRFLAADVLAQRFSVLGADGSRPVAVYCGSGVTAAHEIAALAVAGVDAALYPGSWSQWSNDPDRPAATGA